MRYRGGNELRNAAIQSKLRDEFMLSFVQAIRKSSQHQPIDSTRERDHAQVDRLRTKQQAKAKKAGVGGLLNICSKCALRGISSDVR